MKAVVCRVSRAAVEVDGRAVGQVGPGLLVFVGVMQGDTADQARWLAEKIAALRIFPDDAGKMNRSVKDRGGSVLLISNFTLAGETQKGTRPSFSTAARPEIAEPLFDRLAQLLARHVPVATGRFGAHMEIDARFDGPVTLGIDTP